MEILILIVVVVLIGYSKYRFSNQDYTIGKGMFKNDDNNLMKDDYLDVSDYSFYDNKGQFR